MLSGHGVGIAPSTYYAAKARRPSARALRDAELRGVIARVHRENYDVYGAAEVWDHLNRVEGVVVARCTVERLMRETGLQGARRGRKAVRTTTSPDAWGPEDLVNRDFAAAAPNRLWLADLTYVRTRSGRVYMAFVIDAYSRAVTGRQASRSLHCDLALDALDIALHNRRRTDRGDPSQRPRIAIPVQPLLPAARRQRHHRLSRVPRRQLRQHHERIAQRPLQIGAHPSTPA